MGYEFFNFLEALNYIVVIYVTKTQIFKLFTFFISLNHCQFLINGIPINKNYAFFSSVEIHIIVYKCRSLKSPTENALAGATQVCTTTGACGERWVWRRPHRWHQHGRPRQILSLPLQSLQPVRVFIFLLLLYLSDCARSGKLN